MKNIKKIPIYRLFNFLSKRRKIQVYFLIFLQIINGIFESFSVAAIVPFISIISLRNDEIPIPIFGKILTFLGINDISKSFLFITFSFCFVIIISTFFRIFNLRYTYKLVANLEIELSKIIFEDNILQSYLNYSQKNSSNVITTIVQKVSSTATALCSLLILIGSGILGIFIIGSLLIIDWKVIFVGICFLTFYYLIVYKKVSKFLSNNGKLIASLAPKRLRIMQEVFQGFRDIFVNRTQGIYIKMFNDVDSEYKFILAKTNFIKVFPRYFIEGFVVIVLILLGYSIPYLNIDIYALLPLFGTALYALQKILPLIQLIFATIADYKVRYSSILDVLKELELNNKNKQFNNRSNHNLSFKKSIEFRNIYFGYEKSNFILKNINFKINKGEHIGIFGQTGSGKSTLLDIMIGLLPPSKGEIFVDDISLYGDNSNYNWITKISCVSQNIFLKEGTIAENIAYGQSPKEFNFELLERASRIAQIYEFINQTDMGFETNVGERGIRLSGGQRQRITIARAIYHAREILVLDEATSALDEDTEEKIISGIKRNSNLTILMVTHRLSSLGICDRLFTVKNNKLIEKAKNELI